MFHNDISYVTEKKKNGMLCRVTLVGTDILEEGITSAMRVTRIGQLGMLAVTSN
jgi:hypothetical protein